MSIFVCYCYNTIDVTCTSSYYHCYFIPSLMQSCDGDCDGRPFREGERVATMVIYCDTPQLGGATNFMNAGIHIKPTKYAATFFSYIDPITMNVDDGLTQHSGCPVWEGTKRIVTQWIRLGVDEENSWDTFDTLGVKIDVAENA